MPLALAAHILGNELADLDARLVENDVAHGDAVGERHALQANRGAVLRLHTPARLVDERARNHELGQDRGDDLQGLDLFLVVMAAGAVLDDDDAEGAAAAQDGHAEKGVERILARLRPVGELGMALRVGEIERLGRARDLAHQAFAEREAGLVHGRRVQAFGGEELERLVGRHEIDRAHLGHHVRGDDLDHAVEARLRADGLGHQLAHAPQENSRACSAGHSTSTISESRATAGPRRWRGERRHNSQSLRRRRAHRPSARLAAQAQCTEHRSTRSP